MPDSAFRLQNHYQTLCYPRSRTTRASSLIHGGLRRAAVLSLSRCQTVRHRPPRPRMIHPAAELEGWVEISNDNGETWFRLDEYSTKTRNDSSECYIEASTGQLFRLNCTDLKPDSTRQLAVFCYYDGKLAANRLLYDDQRTVVITGVDKDSETILPFIFNNVRFSHSSASLCHHGFTVLRGRNSSSSAFSFPPFRNNSSKPPTRDLSNSIAGLLETTLASKNVAFFFTPASLLLG